HGLARLASANLLPSGLPRAAALRRIDAMVAGAAALTRADGSLEEAFPYESSFCVTALVAFDLLSAVELAVKALDRAAVMKAVAPLIHFLTRADETHGFISNHLATAAAALYKWDRLGAGATRAR